MQDISPNFTDDMTIGVKLIFGDIIKRTDFIFSTGERDAGLTVDPSMPWVMVAFVDDYKETAIFRKWIKTELFNHPCCKVMPHPQILVYGIDNLSLFSGFMQANQLLRDNPDAYNSDKAQNFVRKVLGAMA